MTFVAACRNRSGSLSRRVGTWLACSALALVAMSVGVVEAQDKKIPEPTNETLSTSDGVGIMCTYFPGTQGKDSVPVILLHEHKKNRRDLEGLGKKLQEVIGAAVIIPDLRGHGDSTTAPGSAKKLDAALFNKTEFPAMIEKDLAAVKLFLLKKNNANELNIDKLAVVGIQMGATIGAAWGQVDWLSPIYLQGKSGQFVKSLVLISPQPNFSGISFSSAVTAKGDPRAGVYSRQVSVMLICGANDPKAKSEAQQVLSTFERVRSKSEIDTDDLTQKTIFKEFAETKLHGTALLGEASLNLDLKIAAFIKVRNIDKPIAWEIRKDTQGQPYK